MTAVALSVPLCAATSLLHDRYDSGRVKPPRTTLDDYGLRLKVEGGVIRSATRGSACIWACVPEPAFVVERTPNGPRAYTLDILNVWAGEMRLRSDMQARVHGIAPARATVQIVLDDTQPHEIRLEYPPKVRESLTFGVFSDTGGRDGYAILPRILRDLAAESVDFAFHVGDTVGRVGRRLRTRWGVQVFDAYMRKAKAPVYFVIGDNDLSGWLSNAPLPWTRQYGPRDGSFSLGSAHFVVLDTTWYTLPARTLRWLEKDLAQAGSKQIFIFMHVPPFKENTDAESCMCSPAGDAFMDIVKRHPGTHVYAGHLQIKADWERAGCHVHITGTGGERIRDKSAGDHYYSHMRVRWDGRQVENVRVNDGLPRLFECTWWRLGFVYPIWLAAHGWEAIGSVLLSAFLVCWVPAWRQRRRRVHAVDTERRD